MEFSRFDDKYDGIAFKKIKVSEVNALKNNLCIVLLYQVIK
jgi:hypothetical protein